MPRPNLIPTQCCKSSKKLFIGYIDFQLEVSCKILVLLISIILSFLCVYRDSMSRLIIKIDFSLQKHVGLYISYMFPSSLPYIH